MSQCVAIATQLDYGFVVQGINPLATFKASLRDASAMQPTATSCCQSLHPGLRNFRVPSGDLLERTPPVSSDFRLTFKGQLTQVE